MLVVYRLILLYGWVLIEAGLGSAVTPVLWLLFVGSISRSIPFFLVIASFRGIHHVHIVR